MKSNSGGHNSAENTTILAVAMSGGVDSSVAAHLLNDEWNQPSQGKYMIGVSHLIWGEEQNRHTEAIERARILCGRLEMGYIALSLEDQFRSRVIDDFIDTYIVGQTPNPCVRCNERIRFSLFYDLLEEQLREDGILSADSRLHFSTGHYVRTIQQGETWFLRKGKDELKDQSYMLYRLDPARLPYLHFPLGEYTKTEVVEIARKAGLPSASVRESQDVCFVDGDYTDLIRRWRKDAASDKPGEIMDTRGNLLGHHRGYIHYTVGQRKGLGLGNGPWYVVRLDPAENRVIVGREEETDSRSFSLGQPNWFIPGPEEGLRAGVQVRYNARETGCTIHSGEEGQYIVELDAPRLVTPGQSAVFYDGEILLGGGIIEGPADGRG